jgi:hypothetical protein
MQKTSDLYKEILSGEHWKECRLVIGDKGNLITEQKERILFGGDSIIVDNGDADSGFPEERIVSMNTYSGLFSENMPVVGESVASEISVTILKPKADIPRMSRVVPYVRLCNEAGHSEWIQKGVYYIDQRSVSGEEPELMHIHGYDAMMFSEADFPSSDAEWPRRDIDVVYDIAKEMDVPVDSRTVEIMDRGYMVQYPAEYSQREVLGYLAAMYAGSFVMSDTGELRLVPMEGVSDTVELGEAATSITKSECLGAFSKVVINVTDELYHEAGDDTGRTLILACPWGFPGMAEDILFRIYGFSYQPFTAEGALLDPAVELCDRINVGGVTSSIYRIDTTFNSNCPANISAPYEEEINYEFPYESKLNREIKRKNKQFSSQLAIQADRISAEVKAREDDIKTVTSTLDVQAGQITAKVNKVQENTSTTFGWNLETDSWRIFAGTSTVLKATKDGLEVKGKVSASSGDIGGFTINSTDISYNGQTWGGEEATGIYIGISGIQLGKNFSVDAAGNLKAFSGEFEGTVSAGNIRHGKSSDGKKDYGTLSGSALSSLSVAGGKLQNYTIDTNKVSAGISLSLGNADYAYNVCTGYTQFDSMIGSYLSATSIRLNNLALGTTQITYKDGNDSTRTLNVVVWSE